jgi:hypothetical protein
MAEGKYNPFTGEVEYQKIEWNKNHYKRYEMRDGKIFDTVANVEVKDPLATLNRNNRAGIDIFRSYSALIYVAGQIARGAAKENDIASALEKFKEVRDQYETYA